MSYDSHSVLRTECSRSDCPSYHHWGFLGTPSKTPPPLRLSYVPQSYKGLLTEIRQANLHWVSIPPSELLVLPFLDPQLSMLAAALAISRLHVGTPPWIKSCAQHETHKGSLSDQESTFYRWANGGLGIRRQWQRGGPSPLTPAFPGCFPTAFSRAVLFLTWKQGHLFQAGRVGKSTPSAADSARGSMQWRRLFLIRHATETPPSSRAPHQSRNGTLSPSELFKSSWRKTFWTRVLQGMPGCRCPSEAGGRGGSRRPPGWTLWAGEGRAGRQGINAWRQTQHDTSRRPLLLYLVWFPELSRGQETD